jgi:hypothetical protein
MCNPIQVARVLSMFRSVQFLAPLFSRGKPCPCPSNAPEPRQEAQASEAGREPSFALQAAIEAQVEAASSTARRLGYNLESRRARCVVYRSNKDSNRALICTPNEDGLLRVASYSANPLDRQDQLVLSQHRSHLGRIFEAAHKGSRIVQEEE